MFIVSMAEVEAQYNRKFNIETDSQGFESSHYLSMAENEKSNFYSKP
jgi:hypothetical protein